MAVKCANCNKVLGQKGDGFLDELMNEGGVKCPKCGKVYCVRCVGEMITVFKMKFECECGNEEMLPVGRGALMLSSLTVHQPDLSPGGGPGVNIPGIKWSGDSTQSKLDKKWWQFWK